MGRQVELWQMLAENAFTPRPHPAFTCPLLKPALQQLHTQRVRGVVRETAVASAAVAATLALQRACAVPWNAPGAPAKEPLTSSLAENLHRLAVVLVASHMSQVRQRGDGDGGTPAQHTPEASVTCPVHALQVPADLHALLGGLVFGRFTFLSPQASAGFVLLRRACATIWTESRLAALASHMHALLKMRPPALAAFNAAIAVAN